MTDVLAVDNSILSATAACSTQAGLRYALGLTTQEDSAPLQAGHACHESLAVFLRGGSVDDAMNMLDFEYKGWAAEHLMEDGDRLSYDNVARIMGHWYATHPPSALPFRIEPNFVEVGFAVPLTDDIVFVGRMDGLVQDVSGAWYVLEHKTTGRLDERWRKRHRSSAQITGYVWAAQQHTQMPVVGCFLNGIELGKLPTDTKKCRKHGVPYPECGHLHATFDLRVEHRAPHQLDEWKRTAIHLAKRYRDILARVPTINEVHRVRTQGQLTGACVDCQFADWCAVGRPAEMASAIMRYEPWSPFEHAFAR